VNDLLLWAVVLLVVLLFGRLVLALLVVLALTQCEGGLRSFLATF
jgi:hypothetical protein